MGKVLLNIESQWFFDDFRGNRGFAQNYLMLQVVLAETKTSPDLYSAPSNRLMYTF